MDWKDGIALEFAFNEHSTKWMSDEALSVIACQGLGERENISDALNTIIREHVNDKEAFIKQEAFFLRWKLLRMLIKVLR